LLGDEIETSFSSLQHEQPRRVDHMICGRGITLKILFNGIHIHKGHIWGNRGEEVQAIIPKYIKIASKCQIINLLSIKLSIFQSLERLGLCSWQYSLMEGGEGFLPTLH